MKRKAAKRITVILVSVGVVGFALLKSIPYFIDKDAIRLAIEDGLHQSTGVNFKIRELQLDPTLFHGIQVQLNTSTITDMKHHPLGSIDNITVQIRYLPLITRQLPEIAKIHLNHVVIPVGQSNFFKELHLKLVKPKQTGFLKPAEMRDTEVLLTDYRIEDTVLGKSVLSRLPLAQSFAVRGHELSLKHLESKKNISLMADGIVGFVPDNAWIAKASPKLTGKPVETTEAVRYRLMVEIPQSVTKTGKFQPSDLNRLELSLVGGLQDLNVQYRREQNWFQRSPVGKGSIQSPGFDVLRGQVLALQFGDTFGLPMPPVLAQTVVAGSVDINSQFNLSFAKPAQPTLTWGSGHMGFHKLALAPVAHPDWPWLGALNGTVNLQNQQLQTNNLAFNLDSLPLNLKGSYRLDNQQINAQLTGKNLQEKSMKDTLSGFGVSASMLNGLNLGGVLDIEANVAGTVNQPVYQGWVTMRNGLFVDEAQGLEANHLTGRVQFKGSGLKKPVVQYQGNLNVADGHFSNAKQGIDVQHFDGKVAFSGQYQPGPTVPLPTYSGQVDVRQAQYKDPKTGLLVSGIQGVIRLGEKLIRLDQFRADFAGSTYTASGQMNQDFKAYSVNVQGDRIDLPKLKQALASALPSSQQKAFSQLQPYNGQARLNLNISTGMNMKGRLDVSSLALHTGEPNYPIQVPHMSVLFENQQVMLPRTSVYVGAVPIDISGAGRTSGQYNVNLASGAVPMSMIRDTEPLLKSVAGVDLPEIWNTEGSLMFQGQVANQGTKFHLDFQNAGLSWQGGDFPLYGLNGSLNYIQMGKNAPVITSRDLNFRYGNSPVALSLDDRGQLNAVAEGVLSSLTVNHYLVSRQSEAIPYQDVPFQVTANGYLAGLPGPGGDSRRVLQRNNIRTYLHFNLDHNFRRAYQGVSATPPAKSMSSTLPTTVEKPSISLGQKLSSIRHPVKTVGHVLSTARQTVQAGLDTLISTTKTGVTYLPAKLETYKKEQAETAEMLQPPAGFTPGDTGASYLSVGLHWMGPSLELEQARLHLFDSGDIQADGHVDNFLDPAKQAYQMHVVTNPNVDLTKLTQGAGENLFFKDAKGQVAMDVTVLGNAEGPKLASGWINTTHVALPYLTLRDLTSRTVLQGETAQVQVDNFEIPGLSASGSGQTLNVFEMPVTLDNVKIHGNLLSIDSLGQFTDQVVQPILVDQIAHNYMRPWQQGDPTIPIQFRNADLQVDEVIYQNIILSNLTSQFSLYANSFMELSNASVHAAGGEAHGYLSMSPNDSSFTTLELNVDNVKANALTKALLNVTNQIFGDVEGTVRFTTFGDTPVDMQKNANGTVSVRIVNGRLPAIAKVETLLTTANIIRGGILGFNLNNLFRSLTFYDTNYFATLSGDMLINNQVLYTRNLSSYGVNLDLLIRGSVRMDNGNANLVVDGRMRQVVAGHLGALGTLSLGGLVQYIPGLGTLGKNRKGLLDYIPGVGWVPGFGGPAGDVNRFRVRLVGDLSSPTAIQDFHWLH